MMRLEVIAKTSLHEKNQDVALQRYIDIGPGPPDPPVL